MRGEECQAYGGHPRRYYLSICCIWIEKISEEWRDITQLMKDMIEQQYVTPAHDSSQTRASLVWVLLPPAAPTEDVWVIVPVVGGFIEEYVASSSNCSLDRVLSSLAYLTCFTHVLD